MTLSEVADGDSVTLSCGCYVERLAAGNHGYVRVLMRTTCQAHCGYMGVSRSVDGHDELRPDEFDDDGSFENVP